MQGVIPKNYLNFVTILSNIAQSQKSNFLSSIGFDMLKLRLSQHQNEIIVALLLFSLALGIRLLYQKESVVDHPIRADAAKYVSAAFNLRTFGVYSLERPRRDGKPPESRSDLSPGYPLFLTLFMREKVNIDSILKVQALMGALVCVFTFVIARLALSLPWAFLAGILTALSPHLIAMDHYLLTESLFTFVMMLGTLILTISWRHRQYVLTLIAGILLAFSAHVRAVNLLFLFFLAPVFFFHVRERLFLPKSIWIKHLALLFAGFAIIAGAHHEFVSLTVTHKSVFLKSRSENNKQAPREAPKHYVKLNNPWAYLKRSIRPPEFFVRGESHVLSYHRNRDYKKPAKGDFWDHPVQYLKWNSWGRLFLLWHWDNAYNGDTYIYPMIRKGFEENPFLKSIHRSMHSIHWPLYLLSLAAPVILLVGWRRKTLPIEQRTLLVPVLGFVYSLAVLSLLSWLPRYTIPARAFSYILASASLSWLLVHAKNWFFAEHYKEHYNKREKQQ